MEVSTQHNRSISDYYYGDFDRGTTSYYRGEEDDEVVFQTEGYYAATTTGTDEDAALNCYDSSSTGHQRERDRYSQRRASKRRSSSAKNDSLTYSASWSGSFVSTPSGGPSGDLDSDSDSDDLETVVTEDSEDEGLVCNEPCRKRRRTRTNSALDIAASTEMLRIRFPFQSITVRLADFFCLQEMDLLNDTMVDFYLNHIVEHILPDDPSKRVTVLPSVFWHNLSILQAAACQEEDKQLSEREQLDIRFGDVLEFVEGFDLLDVDYVVVPVNEWEHWSLAVVCNPFTSKGRIVCFDSQLTDDHNNLQNIATLIDQFLKYAQLKWRDQVWSESLPCIIPDNLVQQTNNFDCGVFILEFARRFLMQPPTDLDAFDFVKEYEDFSIENKRKDMQKAVLSLCTNRAMWAPLLDLLNKRH